MDTDPSHTRRQVAKGTAWAVVMRFAIRGLGLASTLILLRLLAPDDFGVVALATLVAGFLEMMSAIGIEAALISDQKASRDHYNTAWTMRIMKGLLVAVLLASTADLAAEFFNQPKVEAPMYWLAAAAVIQGFENIGTVDFLKHLRYDRDFVFLVAKKVSGVVVTVSLAFVWRSYWALIAGIVSGRVLSVVFSYVLSSYRPRLSLAVWRELFAFSKWNVPRELLAYVSEKIDTFFLGRLSTTALLGFYTVAYDVAFLPLTDFAGPVTRAIFPGLARFNQNPKEFSRLLGDGITLMLLLVVPLAVGISVIAGPVMIVLGGEKWMEAIPILQLLAFGSITGVIASTSTHAFLAVRRPDILAWLVLAVFLVRAPVFFWSISNWGVIGAAYALVGMGIVQALARIALLFFYSLISVRDLLLKTWRMSVAVAIMAGVVLGANAVWFGPLHPLLNVLFSGLLGLITYVSAVYLIWAIIGKPEGPERLAYDFARQFIIAKLKS